MEKDGYDAACSILRTEEADTLESYSKGINHLFNLSRYHRYHDSLKKDARTERFVNPTSKGRRYNKEMRPLLQHIFLTRGLVEELVDLLCWREMRDSGFSEGVYWRILNSRGNHGQRRKQVVDGIDKFDYQSDFKPFVDLRNSLAHDYGKQLTYASHKSDPDLPDSPMEAMNLGHQLASKLCEELYGYTLEKIENKTPEEAEPMWVIRDDLSKGSTYAIMEWILRDVDAFGDDGFEDQREALRMELSRRSYDPDDLHVIRTNRDDKVKYPYNGSIDGELNILELEVERHESRDYTFHVTFKNESSEQLRWRAYRSVTKGRPKEFPDKLPKQIGPGNTDSVEIDFVNLPGDRALVEIGVTGYTDTAMIGSRRRIFCQRIDTGENLGDFSFDFPNRE